MNETMSYYELLGVSETADATEIKRAYFKKIRQYSNQTHPKEFQMLTEAYKLLIDPQKRAIYDQKIDHSQVYNTLNYEVSKAMNQENYHTALELLDELIDNFPDDTYAKYQKAYAFYQLDRLTEAIVTLEEINPFNSNNINYLQLAANIYFDLGEYRPAIRYFEKCLKLDSFNIDYYLRISECYYALGEYSLAIEVLERGLAKGETIHAYPLLLRLFYYTMNANAFTYQKGVVDRLEQLPKSEEEKQILLNWLMEECEKYQQGDSVFSIFIDLIGRINNNAFDHVNTWLMVMDPPKEPETQTVKVIPFPESTSSSVPDFNQSEPSYSVPVERTNGDIDVSSNQRGSVYVSVIIGLILTFFFTPIIGIVGGVIYFFYAAKIKKLLFWLGVLILSLLVIGNFLL